MLLGTHVLVLILNCAVLAAMHCVPLALPCLLQEVEMSYATRLHKPTRTTLNAGFHLGALFPWQLPQGATSADATSADDTSAGGGPRINDRFFLGGLSSLRGFRLHGAGPKDWRSQPCDVGTANTESSVDSLGGDVVASASLGLSFDLPLRQLRETGIHGHVFTAVGSLLPASAFQAGAAPRQPGPGARQEPASSVPSSSSGWVGNVGKSLASGLRMSVGAGIVWPTAIGRLEVSATLRQQYQYSTAENITVTVQHTTVQHCGV